MVNILHRAQNKDEIIWKVVKAIRKTFLLNYVEPYLCYGEISDSLMKSNIDQIEEKLKLNIKIMVLNNVTDKTLNTAAKMFIYLNFCPEAKFLLFIDHVLKTDSLQNIILSLASIIKTSQNAIQRSSTLILKNILENFNLCHYRMIEDMTQYMNGLPNTFKKKCNAKYEGNNVYI